MTASTRSRTAISLMAVALLCFVSRRDPTAAQVSTSTIQGTVSDATGVLPGATVTAREVQSGFTHEAITASGRHVHAGRAEAGTVPDHGERVPGTSLRRKPLRFSSDRPSASVSASRLSWCIPRRWRSWATRASSTRASRRSRPTSRRSSCGICRRTPVTSSTSPPLPQAFGYPTTSSGRSSLPGRCRRRTSTCSSMGSATRTT